MMCQPLVSGRILECDVMGIMTPERCEIRHGRLRWWFLIFWRRALHKIDCEDSRYNIKNTLNTLQQRVNVNIVEFDGEFVKKDLVYGITANRTNKRITVFFRGSVTGGKDWTTNFNAFYKKLERTPELMDAKLTKDIKVHRGFQSEWLLGCWYAWILLLYIVDC